MTTTAVLVDWRPGWLGDAEGASLLLAPLGPQTLLEYLRDDVARTGVDALAVAPNFPADDAYRGAVHERLPAVEVVTSDRFARFLEGFEPSDCLLIIDSRYCPAGRREFAALLEGLDSCRMAKHLVHLRRNAAGTAERVIYDEQRRVRGIQRLYDGVTRVETMGVSCSLLSVSVARHIQNPELFCLADLRTRLAAGGVPSRDITIAEPAYDVTTVPGALAFSETVLTRLFAQPIPDGYRELVPGVWAAPGAQAAVHARLFGPVLLQGDAQVATGAVVIGPAVLGPGTRVARDAIVSESLLCRGAEVPEGRTLINDIVGPAQAAESSAPPTAARGPYQPAAEQSRVLYSRNGRQRSGAPTVTRRRRTPFLIAKRLFDFQAALFGLLLLSPLLAVIAALVKLTSRGPLFFGHHREGRDGHEFRCWKFRTMVDGAHAQQRALYNQNKVDGPQFKMADDPRITSIGRVLRSTNMDELPQLLNVLLGDMSLIGPRPSPFRENQICVPWRKARLSVRPGITGLWQVCRHERSAGDFHQWIYFDMLYVRHMSFMLDVKILLATLLTLGGRWSVPLRWLIPQSRLRRPPLLFAATPPPRSEPTAAVGTAPGAVPEQQPAAAP